MADEWTGHSTANQNKYRNKYLFGDGSDESYETGGD